MDTAINSGVYSAIDPFGSSNYSFEISTGIAALGVIDTRHQQSFRYFESGNPFEYDLVRFLYHEKREIESGKRFP
jgi:phospholipid-binding lipoprotein MlaA